MKKYLIGILATFFMVQLKAQSIYILIRHAEKDTTQASSTKMNANPNLSQQGFERANKLVTALQDYTIDEIYATNFLRTQQTVTPLANSYHKSIITYDYKTLAAFADTLLQQKNKTIIIAGHNTTTPALVNLLIKKQQFAALDESVYNKIFIVTIDNKHEATVKVVDY